MANSIEKYSFMENLDRTDRKILELLQQDCRITIKELAEKLHLTNTPVYERVKKLERSGIIKNYLEIRDLSAQRSANCLKRNLSNLG